MNIISKPRMPDDRNRPVRIINGYWLGLTRLFLPSSDVRLRAAARHLLWERAWVPTSFPRSQVLVIAAVMIVGFVSTVYLGVPNRSIWIPAFLGCWAALVFWTILDCSGRSLAPATIETLLRAGRCAGCVYPVEAMTVCADGCVVCPECGAAWRGDRIGRTEA